MKWSDEIPCIGKEDEMSRESRQKKKVKMKRKKNVFLFMLKKKI